MYAKPWHFVFLSKGGYTDCHRCYSHKDQKESKNPADNSNHNAKTKSSIW